MECEKQIEKLERKRPRDSDEREHERLALDFHLLKEKTAYDKDQSLLFSMQILTTILPKGMENFLEMLINKAICQERLYVTVGC